MISSWILLIFLDISQDIFGVVIVYVEIPFLVNLRIKWNHVGHHDLNPTARGFSLHRCLMVSV